jgi:long-chain fatty acid transport protein
MNPYLRLLLVVVLVGISWNAFAITDEEIFRNFQFSFVNPGARSSAIGGAFIGLADDATAAEANPAGLTILTKPEVSFEYRHTTFNATELNSVNLIGDSSGSVAVGSTNNLENLDQPSFVSVVYPTSHVTFAFSRYESVRAQGNINEVLSLNGGNVAAIGETDQKVANYNFTIAKKLMNKFSLGGTVGFSKLDWTAGVRNFLIVPQGELLGYSTTLDDTDSSISFNIGAKYDANSHFSIGAVYKKNPKFEVTETEVVGVPQLTQKPGPFTNVFRVPDSFGVGAAVKPNDSITVTADVVRIQYSQLTDGFQAGYNFINDKLTNQDISFKVDDGTEFHVGTEFVIILKNVPIALRQGYYRKPSNSLVVDTLDPRFGQDARNFLDAFYTERGDENHFTFGNGFVLGPHFQVDWALDIANSTDAFVLSTVARF